MIILDAQLPPSLAVWIADTFEVPCFSAQFLNLRHAEDEEILPLIWLTCGNTSKNRLKEILSANLAPALTLLETNDLVEITGF